MLEVLSQEATERISEALAGGREIEAIQIYREATGKGLQEAEDFIDALIPQLIADDPQRYQALARSQSDGCAKVALLLLILAAGAVILLVNFF